MSLFRQAPIRLREKAAPLYAELAAARMRLALIKLAFKAGYKPTQPRVPAGDPNGGQWAGGGSGRSSVPRRKRGTTEADNRDFVTKKRAEAQKLADALGHGADANEFLALSSVESTWGSADAASMANNYFGIHNSEKGPFPGQTGTYITSGTSNIPGQVVPGWISPFPDRSPKQAVAAFAPDTGFLDSGMVAVSKLKTEGIDYSNPATFFANVHARGWAEGANAADYVHTMLQRYRHVGRY